MTLGIAVSTVSTMCAPYHLQLGLLPAAAHLDVAPSNFHHVEYDHEEAAHRRQQPERQRQKNATKGKGPGDGEVWRCGFTQEVSRQT
ncbi:hypothetical protein FF1_038134 [Malus domestica]